MYKETSFPTARRHTYYFLEHAKQFSPVYLDTEVDFSKVNDIRKQMRDKEIKLSYISFVIFSITRVLKNYPEANTAIKKSLFPRVVWYKQMHAKFTMDRDINNTRAVLSGLIPKADEMSLIEIQDTLNYYRDNSFEDIKEFGPVKKLQTFPTFIGQWIYNRTMSKSKKREKLQGTFTVTSLGHQPIRSFYPIISSTTCFGVGAIHERVVLKNNLPEPVSYLILSLAFDHRAIDGAMAADILTDVKNHLEKGEFLL
ncbi:2-oxo acid dehydrogenase subunit E2 [Shouchella patagoniensis]|uniref:2-oxo acid dehydrogenase subunit E2 n=1 Tax=Shouchella patagoniensis TaxID=228576 RepID=UPI000995C740|nr:2-oxo acid dehydrogenase subunit E2 [Shouchella patagoniensis]